LNRAFARLARTSILAVPLAAWATTGGVASAPAAGTRIANTATATYRDGAGASYGTQSNTTITSIAQVSAIVVSPKEPAVDPNLENYPVGTPVTRTFTIQNAGNVADAYTIVTATTGGGTIVSIAFATPGGLQPVTLGSTVSPTLQPGQTIKVQIVVNTAGVGIGTSFPVGLTARSTNRSTSNGLVTDYGREWAVATPGASLAGTAGRATAIVKLVDAARSYQAHPGETVTYSIAFRNYGGATANNVTLTDPLPIGIAPQLSTVTLNGTSDDANATLSGQVLTVPIGTLPVGATDTVTFQAVVGPALSPGTSYVNTAVVAADGIKALGTTPASVLVGTANIVYDGYSGSAPIAGATATLTDPKTHAAIALPIGSAQLPGATGIAPNTRNADPYVTGSGGAYSLVLSPAQIGSAAAPATYELDLSAPGYNSRRIGVSVTPDATGLLWNVTLRALDGQQLAQPGGYRLIAGDASLFDIFGTFGNLPMFASHPLAVGKTVDRDVASGGDRLFYTLQANSGGQTFGRTSFVDTLPPGVAFAPGTARVDGIPAAPAVTGQTVTWTLPSLGSGGHTITYAAVVVPSVPDGSTLVNFVDVTATAAGGAHVSASASADTQVVAGALGSRIVITGRVFADVSKTGYYQEGDHGISGVRVYLENGEYVVTDHYGRYTFPSVNPGQHVLHVDETSFGAGVRAWGVRDLESSRSTEQLVHGIFDAGLMHDVNFALDVTP
jgi:uncharacterized repeat protein (TIGR01451 family)